MALVMSAGVGDVIKIDGPCTIRVNRLKGSNVGLEVQADQKHRISRHHLPLGQSLLDLKDGLPPSRV